MDNHDVDGLSSAVQTTPIKKRCLRPLLEQLLGRARPQAMHMSVLDAATNDLTQLINHLDLEAMPGSRHDRSPNQQSPSTVSAMGFNPGKSPVRTRVLALESPVKKSGRLRMNILSISSLRPYAQARKKPQPTIFESPPTMVMSLASWYDSIPFHFRIFSISAPTLTYHDAWNRCDTSHELHESTRSRVHSMLDFR